MELKLPVIKLLEDHFYVDVKHDRLVNVKNNKLIIPIDGAKDEGDGYRIKYDPAITGLPDLNHFEEFVSKTPFYFHYYLNELSDDQLTKLMNDFEKERGIVELKIPSLKDLDPWGMAKRYDKDIKELSGKTDWEIIVDQRLYEMRVDSGMLPKLLIDNHIFYVDYRLKEFRPDNDFLNTIRFQELIHKNIGGAVQGSLRAPYLPAKHSLSHINLETITAIPKGTIIVDLPLPELLDPVGFARDQKLDVKDYLRGHPLTDASVAKIIPWKDTSIPSVIEKNKKAKKIKRGKGIN